MKILLLQDVGGLGRKGEVKEVKEGYAQNYLLPQKKGEFLNKHSLKVVEDQKRKSLRLQGEKEKDKTKTATKINGHTFFCQVKADEKGTLYAQFNKQAISDLLKENGFDVAPEEIKIEGGLKKTGEHDIEIKIGGKQVKFKIILNK
jgi:large subunit ribosomal protein L9